MRAIWHPPKRRKRAVGQEAWPVSIRPLCRIAASKPPAKTPGSSHRTIRRSDTRASRRARCRAHLNLDDLPKRHERAPAQDAGLVSSNHPLKRHMSEPLDKPPGPPRTSHRSDTSEPSGNMPCLPRTIRRCDTRVSRRARCQACLNPDDLLKRHERAVGRYAGPVWIRTIRRSDT